jgi:hypothetical protein
MLVLYNAHMLSSLWFLVYDDLLLLFSGFMIIRFPFLSHVPHVGGDDTSFSSD